MRRQALWRPDLCGLWVRYSSYFSSPLRFLLCILSHSYVPLCFLFSFSVFLGGPASRRRKEQGYLGASHILKPDGGLKVHTSIQLMSYTAHFIFRVSSLPIPVISHSIPSFYSPLLSSLPFHPSACHQEESNHCGDEGTRQSAHSDPHFGRIRGHRRGHIGGVRTHHGQGGCYGVSRIQEPFKVEDNFQTVELINRIFTHRFPHTNECDILFTQIISLQPLLFITPTFFS
jgi:hypothetical protein